MTDLSNLEQLLDRVVKATGADRELDRDIASFFGDYVKCEPRNRTWRSAPSRKGPWRTLPDYTSSVDAAIAFIERVLPGWAKESYEAPNEGVMVRLISPTIPSTEHWGGSRTATLPLALVAAALSALIVKEKAA